MSGRPSRVLLRGPRVVCADGVLEDGWVLVEGERIAAVGAGPVAEHDAVTELQGWLLPGFVDLHVHGGGGHDVTSSPGDLAAAVDFHRRHGTTSTLVSLVTAPLDALERQLGWVADAAADDPGVLGAHLEGPYLSHARCGAQNPAYLRAPQRAEFDRLLAAARGVLRSITVAPELPGGPALIGAAAETGAVAAIGHTDATYAEAMAGIEAGARLATHLFNGMRPIHHREPGPAVAALRAGLVCEIINDGVHLHPAVPALVAERPGRLAFVTDAIDAAGMGDGEVVLGGQRVQVRDGQARLVPSGSLAGSTLTMDAAVRRAVRESGLDVVAASAAASGTPARLLGLDGELGAVAPGLVADLVLLDDELNLRAVMSRGRWLAG
jgi:N-acetylglucosamine-6-phosphate deacetylase